MISVAQINIVFRSLIILTLPIITLVFPASAQETQVKKQSLVQFRMQSSAVVGDPEEKLSDPGYDADIFWFPVEVPTTVLNGLVKNHVYPDPYTGMNNMRIPDASDAFNRIYDLEKYSHLPNHDNPWKQPYYFRTTFVVPETDAGKNFQLIFKGINYRAAVWLNGIQVADSARMAGMFAEYRLDVSRQVTTGGKNALLVKIYPLDYPGIPSPEQLEAMGDFYPNGGPTGDIGKNVTMLCSIGWDWIPPVRDRNIGIWQPVFLQTSGPVIIENPHIITGLPDLPDTSNATLALNLSLKNYSGEDKNGRIKISITPENFEGVSTEFTQNVRVMAGKTLHVHFVEDELKVNEPHLWWPNGYGKPNLYRLKVQYIVDDVISDETSFLFGIRTVGTKAVEEKDKFLRRDFYVNGRKVNLTGGAWVPDMMLNRDSLRYAQELSLCRHANANLVRIWGGGITPPDEFFNQADRNGLLIWSDFWVTGDTQGEFKGSPDWPLETEVFIRNMTSTIYRIRNHPSLLVWTGGNEGHARKELYDAMRDSVISLDGTRPFIPSSSGFAHLPDGWKGSWPDNKLPGVYSGGPYTWNEPAEYFRRVDLGRDWVFKDETGLPSQPPYNTLMKIIPDLIWDKNLPFPLNNTWGYHDAATGNGRYDRYYADMIKRYGIPGSMEAFSDKMQLMNAEGYRSIFEAAGHKLSETGGVMLWKLNAAFPSVIWQIYDWFLQPNAGYYFMRNACEPVHIQFNYNDSSIAVINRTYHPAKDLNARVRGYDLQGKLLFEESGTAAVDAESTSGILSLADRLTGNEGIIFIILTLTDKKGNPVSRNTYWLNSGDEFSSLDEMQKASLDVKVSQSSSQDEGSGWKMIVSNPAGTVAFFIRPQIIAGGEEIQPVYWSDSYFTLAPGDSVECSVYVPSYLLKGNSPEIHISGLNADKKTIRLPE